MDNWISYFLEANLYLLIIGLSYQLGFKKNQNFKFGRPFLVIGTLSAFLFPLMKSEKLALASKSFFEETMLLDTITIQPVQTISFDFQLFAFLVICIGALLKFSSTAFGMIRLNQLKNKATKIDNFYLVPASTKAFSFLNSIFIGEEIPDSKKDLIYKHELIHTKKGHSIDVLFMQIVQAVVWYNPIVYLTAVNLKELHEFEADHYCHNEESAYVDLLLQQSFENYKLSFIHQFNSNHLKNRIMRIQKKSNYRISKMALLTTLVLLIGSIAISQNVQIIKQGSILDLSGLEGLSELDKLSELSKLKELDQLAELKNLSQLSEINLNDKKAEYPGGQEALANFLGKEIKYPKVSQNQNSEGTVYVKFTVGKDGVCKDFKIARGVSEALDQAALKALKKMPKWAPAVKDGKTVSTEMTIPVKFVLPPPPPPPPAPPTPNPSK